MRKKFKHGDIVHVNTDLPQELHVIDYYVRTEGFVNVWFLPAGQNCTSMVHENNMTLVATGKEADTYRLLYGKKEKTY